MILKQRYLIHNKDNKIFVMLEKVNDKLNVYLPTKNFEHENIVGDILPVTDDDCILLLEEVNTVTTFDSVDIDTVNYEYRIEKKYYSLYHNFTYQEKEAILNFCLKKGWEPDFLSYYEIVNLCSHSKREVNVDSNLKNASYVLKKQLKYGR